MPSNHLILCHPLLLLLSIFPNIRVFSKESVLPNRGPKYWSFSFSVSPSNEYSGLISFRMDWLDLLAVQGTQESSPTPQFKSISSSVLSFLYSPTVTSMIIIRLKLFRVHYNFSTLNSTVWYLFYNFTSVFISEPDLFFCCGETYISWNTLKCTVPWH